MSNYMNYEKAALLYDEARVPAGSKIMCNIFTGILQKHISEISLLDVGCGTGNYSLEFLKNGIKEITMVDASESMLNCAELKTKLYSDYITLKKIVLPDLDFPDNSYDVISFIQVLHHIDSAALKNSKNHHLNRSDYPNLITCMEKAYKILKPGGVLLLDVMFDKNVESFWWTRHCPIAAEQMKRLRIDKKDLLELLSDLRFEDVFYTFYPGDRLLKPEIYDDIDRISDSEWRMYLSQYKLVEKSGELEQLIEKVNDAKLSGNLQEFFVDSSKKLWTHGNHSTVFAQKPKQ